MEFLKSITGKLLTGVIALVVIAGAISWWRMDEATRSAVLSGSGKIAAWIGVVLFMPWANFLLIARVARMQSNTAGGVLVAAMSLIEALGLMWLFGWSIHGGTAWTFFLLGVLFAAVYNLFSCDWIAEKME